MEEKKGKREDRGNKERNERQDKGKRWHTNCMRGKRKEFKRFRKAHPKKEEQDGKKKNEERGKETEKQQDEKR